MKVKSNNVVFWFYLKIWGLSALLPLLLFLVFSLPLIFAFCLAQCFFSAFFAFWILRKKRQGWYELTFQEQMENYHLYWVWSGKGIKKILKNRRQIFLKNLKNKVAKNPTEFL